MDSSSVDMGFAELGSKSFAARIEQQVRIDGTEQPGRIERREVIAGSNLSGDNAERLGDGNCLLGEKLVLGGNRSVEHPIARW